MAMLQGDFLTSLTDYDNEHVVQLLKKRFENGEIYSAIGPNILLALNPQQPIALYNDSIAQEIHSKESDKLYLQKPAHIFSTALSSYQQMMDNDQYQAIIFTGEHGSGKSESMKYALKELVNIMSEKHGDLGIVKKILTANFLIEAVGHCHARQNQNANHIGKLIEIQYNREGNIVGAQFFTFLLDAKRVVQRPAGEGSFHILHALMEDAPEALKETLQLNQGKGFFNIMKDTSFDGYISFAKIERAMTEFGMKASKRENIFKFLAALFHLGNVEFSEDKKAKQGKRLYPSNEAEFNQVCTFMQVDAMALLKALTSRDDVNKEKHNGRVVSLTVEQAQERRDTLVRQLYQFFVSWLTSYICKKISAKGFQTAIGLLEIPGFVTSSEPMNFYDYCRNFTHEKMKEFLEGHFLVDKKNNIVLETKASTSTDKSKRKKKKHGKENATQDSLIHISNRELLDMMVHSTPFNITQALQEESRYVSQDPEGRYDSKWLKQISGIFKEKNTFFLKTSKKNDYFAIKHCLADGFYKGEQCVRDNSPFISHAMFDVLTGSENSLMLSLISERAITVQEDSGFLRRLVYHKATEVKTSTAMISTPKKAKEIEILRNDDSTYIVQLESQLDQIFDFLSPMNLWQVCCMNETKLENQVQDLQIAALCEFYGRKYPYRFEDEQFIDYCHPFFERWVEEDYQAQGKNSINNDLKKPETMHSMLTSLFKTERDRSLFLLERFNPSHDEYLIGEHSQLFLCSNLYCNLEAHIHSLPRDEKLLRKEHLRKRRRHNVFPTMGDLNGATNALSRESQDSDLIATSSVRQSTSGSSIHSRIEHDGFNTKHYGTEDWMVMMKQNGGYLDIKRTSLKKKEFNSISEKYSESPQNRYLRKVWLAFTWSCTWMIPECLLSCLGRMKDKEVRLAWREKVALCMIIGLVSGILLFWITGFAGLICPRPKTFTWATMRAHTTEKDAWVGIHGKAVDVTKFLPVHLGGRKTIMPFLGHDASPFFPKEPIKHLGRCIANRAAAEKSDLKNANKCSVGKWKYCHKSIKIKRLLKKLTVGDIGFPPYEIRGRKTKKAASFTIGKKVYDVTKYLEDGNLYLRRDVNRIIINHLGEDASSAISRIPDHKQLLHCFDKLFYAGLLTEDYAMTCRITDIILLSSVGTLVSIMVFKFITALQLSAKRDPEHHDKFVMMMVPCYTEGESSLRKTIDSLATMEYEDSHKLIFCVADGVITGSGNNRPTPQLLLELLGADPTYDPPPFAYSALGEGWKQLNYAKVYSGIYYCGGHRVPYVVVVKSGRQNEGSKPGNRGKRDSQLLILKFLNKMQYDLAMTPLELEIYRHVNDVIGVDPNCYEYLMTVDADTEVKPDSLNRMVSCMVHDTKVMALCGETEVSNSKASWVAMIQVYEYYMSHHISKAFESLFGSVTCLPGCFSLYRIRLPGQRLAPCLTLPEIIQDYSVNTVDTLHKKNLLHLGEDRYLTTLMLKYFPRMKLSFTSDALCRTVVPDRWSILLSQRRRWINSTIHNLMELLLLKDLCGCCCFSMKFVVLIDMFATMVMPTGVAYMFYLMYVSIQNHHAPLLALIILGSMFGLQAILFLIKKQWQHIGWMVIYIFSIPIFHFIIPLYAFWHFDDFSWGQTRKVQLDDGTEATVPVDDEEEFDVNVIPMRRLGELEEEKWAKHIQDDEKNNFNDDHFGLAYDEIAMQSYNTNQMYGISMMNLKDQEVAYKPSYYANSMAVVNSPKILATQTLSERPSVSSSVYSIDEDMLCRIQEAERNGCAENSNGEPSDSSILFKIKEILSSSDWSQLSKHTIRKQLDDIFYMDLSDKRAFINACIDYFIQEPDGI